MRSEYNVLIIPYLLEDKGTKFCILKRTDMKIWQFPAGGGEDGETFQDSALRELSEETGRKTFSARITRLDSLASVSIDHFQELSHLVSQKKYVIPEYSFAYKMENENIVLSSEHAAHKWVNYQEALDLLAFDLDKTALYELTQRFVYHDL